MSKFFFGETPGKAARNAILPTRCNNGRRDGRRGGMERETRVQCRRPRRPRPRVRLSNGGGKNGNNGPATAARRPPPTQSRRPLVRPLVLKDYDEKYARELPR